MKGLPCRDVQFDISGPNIDPKITFLIFYESLLMTGCYLGFSEILEMVPELLFFKFAVHLSSSHGFISACQVGLAWILLFEISFLILQHCVICFS